MTSPEMPPDEQNTEDQAEKTRDQEFNENMEEYGKGLEIILEELKKQLANEKDEKNIKQLKKDVSHVEEQLADLVEIESGEFVIEAETPTKEVKENLAKKIEDINEQLKTETDAETIKQLKTDLAEAIARLTELKNMEKMELI